MENYIFESLLGHGSFGVVWKATRKSDGDKVAIKEIDFGNMNSEKIQLIINEIKFLRKLKSPYIVKYIDHIVDLDKHKIFIIMEFCPGGDLKSLIVNTIGSNSYISEDQIWLCLTEMALALHECHCGSNTIIHRDIKPENIFLNSEGHIKLGDFGLARHLIDYAKTVLGTPYYMSPEISDGKKYNEKSDIWALGCTIYEMTTLHPPFTSFGDEDLKEHIKYDKIKGFNPRYSESLFRIVSMMLEKDPSKRPNIQQILDFRNVKLTLKIKEAREELENIRTKTALIKQKYALLAKNNQVFQIKRRRHVEKIEE